MDPHILFNYQRYSVVQKPRAATQFVNMNAFPNPTLTASTGSLTQICTLDSKKKEERNGPTAVTNLPLCQALLLALKGEINILRSDES